MKKLITILLFLPIGLFAQKRIEKKPVFEQKTTTATSKATKYQKVETAEGVKLVNNLINLDESEPTPNPNEHVIDVKYKEENEEIITPN